MALHRTQTDNHKVESYTYANAAAREIATGFITADIGRLAYQADTGEYYRLTSIAPTWQIFGGFNPPQYASAPTYVKGVVYFDTTLNKLRVGGAAGWETITSV
jgi:hypothetical protein